MGTPAMAGLRYHGKGANRNATERAVLPLTGRRNRSAPPPKDFGPGLQPRAAD